MSFAARILLITVSLLAATGASAQRERQIQPAEESQYGRKFFVQLRGLFGRFREADLQRAFEKAQPIQCSELVNDNGEWRTVAFFNEKRELGDWYRANLEEVKTDLSVFIFKGVCRGEHGPVQLITKFPVTESIEAYNERRIGLDEVDINVNAPVRASFESPIISIFPPVSVSRQDAEAFGATAARRTGSTADVIDHWPASVLRKTSPINS
jgi:hypothetical protein